MANQQRTAFTRRQWMTMAAVGVSSPFVPISWPQAAQHVPVTIRYNHVRHIKNLIPTLVQSPEFFHQPHGEDLAAQLYRGLYNGQEPRQATIRQITKNFNTYGPERAVWSMVTSKTFDRIRRPLDWDSRLQFENVGPVHFRRERRNAAYLNSRLERLYEGLYGRRPTSFELTDSLRDLLVPVRTEQLLVSQRGSLISVAYAQDFDVSSENHTITFNADQVLTTAILAEIAVAATLSRVAQILVPLGVSLFATAPLTSIAVTVIGTTIFLTALIPFGLALYQMGYDVPFLSLSSQPGSPPGSDQPGGTPSEPPPSDPPPSDPGPPPGASMDVSVSIGDSPVGDSPAPGSDPGDPGDGSPGDGGDGGGDF
jgi:hypothetical protein